MPALQWLGHEVWTLPTILLASRPGLGRFVRHELPAPGLQAMLTWPGVRRLLGFRSMPCSPAISRPPLPWRSSRMRSAASGSANPKTVVLVDPILGDAGRLYVPGETAAAIRDRLLPLADIATPNLFELQWLSRHAPSRDLDEVARLARALGPQRVVVTSAARRRAKFRRCSSSALRRSSAALKRRDRIPNGAGDLFAGLLLGYLLNGRNPRLLSSRA